MSNEMPSKSPSLSEQTTARLKRLGERLRKHREEQRVSATVAAEAAGMSRVTLHRIERGEPSVTMGAYLNAIDAVGLIIEVRDPEVTTHTPVSQLPTRVALADYPELKRLAWQLGSIESLTPEEALGLYERNWRHIERSRLEPSEQALIDILEVQLGGGRLLV